MRTFKKVLLFLVVGVMGMATLAQAMDSRKQVFLGSNVGENYAAGVVLDTADAFTNPAYLVDYKGLIGLEGTKAVNDLYTGFGYIPLSKFGLSGTLAVQVGRNFGLLKQSSLSNNPSYNINNLDANLATAVPALLLGTSIDGSTFTDLSNTNSFGLMYGMPVSSSFNAGLAINYVGQGLNGKAAPGVPNSADVQKSITDTEIRLGTEFLLGGGVKAAADLGIGMPGYHFSYSSAPLTQKADMSAMNLDLNLRLAMPVMKDADVVFLGGYAGSGGEIDTVPDTRDTTQNVNLTQTQNDLYLAVGGVLKNSKGFTALQLGMLSRGYNNDRVIPNNTPTNTKTDTGYFAFPAIGLLGERAVLDWLTLRASVLFSSEGSSTSNTAGGVTYTTNGLNSSSIKTAIGSTITFDSFVIESVLAKQLLFNGPYLVGGVAGTGLNSSVSVGYMF